MVTSIFQRTKTRTTVVTLISLSLVGFAGSFSPLAANAAPKIVASKFVEITGVESAAKSIDQDTNEQEVFLRSLQEGDVAKAKAMLASHGATGLENAQIHFNGPSSPPISAERKQHCKTTTTTRILHRGDGTTDVEITTSVTCG